MFLFKRLLEDPRAIERLEVRLNKEVLILRRRRSPFWGSGPCPASFRWGNLGWFFRAAGSPTANSATIRHLPPLPSSSSVPSGEFQPSGFGPNIGPMQLA
eukprot:11408921-Alexandrium_andersonii.AAC.1